MLSSVRNIILGIIDLFHKPFSRWIDQQTFRYLACGGGNTVFGIVLYAVFYNFVLQKQPIPITDTIKITPHVAAFIMSFCINFPTGFALSKYIVFTESNLKGRIQLFRYALLVGVCIVLNYVFIKLFVEICGFYPTPSYILTSVIVAVFSYVSQRNFSFKVKEAVAE